MIPFLLIWFILFFGWETFGLFAYWKMTEYKLTWGLVIAIGIASTIPIAFAATFRLIQQIQDAR